VYAKSSAAKKAKHWQLRNPGKERDTGPTGVRKTRISATNVSNFVSAISTAVSAISALSDTTKRASKEVTDDDPQTHPNVITLPRFANRPRRPNKTDPLPYVYLPFEPFAWQLTLDIIYY